MIMKSFVEEQDLCLGIREEDFYVCTWWWVLKMSVSVLFGLSPFVSLLFPICILRCYLK